MSEQPQSQQSRSPRKKLKMEDGNAVSTGESLGEKPEYDAVKSEVSGPGGLSGTLTESVEDQLRKEIKVGISQYVNPELSGFEGVLKKRYTDFLVNEILPGGTVVHLDNTKVPKPSRTQATLGFPERAIARPPQMGSLESVSKEKPPQTGPAQIVSEEKASQTSPTENVSEEKVESTLLANEGGQGAPEKTAGASAWRQFAGTSRAFTLAAADRTLLEETLGSSAAEQALDLFNRVMDSTHRTPAQYGVVKAENSIERATRTTLHEAIRRIFSKRLDSYTEPDGTFVIGVAKAQASNQSRAGPSGRDGRGQGRAQQGPRKSTKDTFAELGGDFLHFTLYKENKDTLEVVSYISRQLHLQPRAFQFAGNKDRRAITVQRVSVHRVQAPRLAGLNATLRGGSKIGNFSYEKGGLSLGELDGNEFIITLRECKFPGTDGLSMEEQIQKAEGTMKLAVELFSKDGFLNYYGMQRFGTFATRTDTVGVKLLQGDFEGAVNAILNFHPDALHAAQNATDDTTLSYDDKARALAIDIFRSTGATGPALEKLPRKFSAESNIIRTLGSSNGKGNFLGAIQSIPRNLRLMYGHAYQSNVWNHAASHRWALAGAKVLKGDLVLVNEHREEDAGNGLQDGDVDEDGEPVVRPSNDDRAIADDERYERARALTKEEVEGGKYSIYDVVLPTPGYDVLYPDYMVAFYEELMGTEEMGGLDPHHMRRNVRDLSLSGNYRKLVARPMSPCTFHVVSYKSANEQFVKTDLDKLNEARRAEAAKQEALRLLKAGKTNPGPEAKSGLELGLDGAMESKIAAVKNFLGPGEHPETETHAESSNVATETASNANASEEVVPTEDGHVATHSASLEHPIDGANDSEAPQEFFDAEARPVTQPGDPVTANPIAQPAAENDAAIAADSKVNTFTTRNEPADDPDKTPRVSPVKHASSAPEMMALNVPTDFIGAGAHDAPDKLAVVITLQLPSSTYATMALRELTKGGTRAYKPDFGGGR